MRSEASLRRVLATVAILAVLLIGGFVAWANHHLSDEWAITPGFSQAVGPLITVSGHAHERRSTIYLTDVYLTQLTVWQEFLDELHAPAHAELINSSYVTPPNVPTSQIDAEGYLEMYDSQNDAKAAAMTALHLDVRGSTVGATVVAINTKAPAAGVLSVGDRVVSVDGRRVRDVCALDVALANVEPGRDVRLRIEPASYAASGQLTYGSSREVETPTSRNRYQFNESDCRYDWRSADQLALAGVPWLGVDVEDAVAWHFPVSVSINTANIGGPSAGLSMALGIIDALSKVSITGNLRIAATGQIAPNGAVGDVGGVAEKTIAVEEAGATVFLVPSVEQGPAESMATKRLHVLSVTTLAQALADLRRLGGPAPVLISSTARRVTRS